MQNFIKSLVFILSIASVVHADSNKWSTSISYVGMAMDYKEYSNSGVLLDSENSSFQGIEGSQLGVMYQLNDSEMFSTYFESNLMSLSGNSDYVGSILGSGNSYGSYLSKTVNKIVDIELKVKQSMRINNNFSLLYGLGVGYRLWERELTTTFIEDYEWYSVRVLGGFKYVFNRNFSIGSELEYQYGFNEVLSATGFSGEFELGSADIWKLSIPIVYSYNEKVDFIASMIFSEQTIGRSNVINGYYEPDSTAKNQYIQLGLNFKY